MDRRKLARLKADLRAKRRSPQKARDLEALARQLGRRSVNRGKEPTWESSLLRPPLSIPHHGGRDLAPGTRNCILDVLEGDVLAWEELLDLQGDGDEEEDEG